MLKVALRTYQNEAVEKGMQYDGFLLIPEQRTGKTPTALAMVDRRKPDVLFIICPKRAIGEWERQMVKVLEIDWECEVWITNFEECSRTSYVKKWYRRQVRKWLKQGTVYMIVDEAHRIKKRGSAQSMFVRSLGKICTWRLALTGTPIAQGIQDAWALLDFVMHGEAVGSFENFAEEYLVFDKRFGKFSTKVKKTRNEEAFYVIFHQYSYRLTFREARRKEGLPGLKIRRRKILFDLKPQSWEHYRELEEDLETYVNGDRVTTPLVLTLTMKLQQLAGGFLIQTEKIPGKRKKKRTIIPVGQEKLYKLFDLLPELNGKSVICCRFVHEMEAIAKRCEEEGMTIQWVGGKHDDWDGDFWADLVLLQVQAGIAIDLSMAKNYIFYSWDYSYINYEQAKFRIISFDSKQVNYYYLLAEGTVDEPIYEAVAKKKDLATLICDRYRHENREKNRGNQRRAA